MRPHWKTGSPLVRSTIEAWMGSEGYPAEVWLLAASAAYSMGFDFDPPATPILDALEKAKRDGDKPTLARIFGAQRGAMEHERVAKSYWDSLAGWRATKPGASNAVSNPNLPAMLEKAGANAETNGASVSFRSNSSTREASK